MTRVYLLADFGKGPVCVWYGISGKRWVNYPLGVGNEDAPLSNRFASGSHADATVNGTNMSRVWWLVEAESADAARAIIAGPESCDRCDGSREEPGAPVEQDGALALCSSCSSGRILASGGAR